MPTEVQLISDGAVTGAAISNLTITADDIASNAVTKDKILNGTIGAGKLGSNSVSSSNLLSSADNDNDRAVSTNHIRDNTVTPAKLSTGGPSWTTERVVSAASFSGPLTGNATSATTFSTNKGNYRGITDGAVAGQLMWKNYGNNHTIFDASQSTSPDGGGVNNTNSQVAWTGSYPTLMGWNGANTYGVRVDSARVSDSTTGNAASVTNGVYTNNFPFNHTSRGYQQFPGGFIIQWGSSGSLGQQDQFQTFAIPFPGGVFSVLVTPNGGGGNPGNKRDHWLALGYQLNGFTLRSYFESGAASYSWVAFGA